MGIGLSDWRHFFSVSAIVPSLLTQHQVHRPAPSDMLAGLAAVVQDVGVIAGGVFEGVGEDGKTVEGAVIVDGLGQCGDVRRSPGRIDGDGTEGVAEELTKQFCPYGGVSPQCSIPFWAPRRGHKACRADLNTTK